MVPKTPPSSFFKGFSNERLETIFKRNNIELGIDWEKRKPASDTLAAAKWIEYAVAHKTDANVIHLYEVFQYICVLTKARTNSTYFIRQAETDGSFSLPLPDDFDELNRTEQAACIYLNEPNDNEGTAVLKCLAEIIYAKDLNYSQDKFVEYQTEPAELNVDASMQNSMTTVLNDFFAQEQKGDNCVLECYPHDRQWYFFGTLDGNKQYLEMKFRSGEAFSLQAAIMPYSVILIFDMDAGKLSIHTPTAIRQAKCNQLAENILNVLVNRVDKSLIPKDTYDLSCFANLLFAFPQMLNEKVRGIHATKIGILPQGQTENEIIFINTRKDDAYRSFIESIGWFQMRKNINANNVDFPQAFTVTMIGIQIEMEDNTKINFALQPKGCTQSGHASEEKRKIVEALITKLDIRRRG